MVQITKDSSGVTWEATVVKLEDDGSFKEVISGDGWETPEDAIDFYVNLVQALGNPSQQSVPYEVNS